MPFSLTPLQYFFEINRPIAGSRRTINIACYFLHESPFEVTFGPVLRIIMDLGKQDHMEYAMDVGIETQTLSDEKNAFNDIFHDGEYVKMPLGKETGKVVNAYKLRKGAKEGRKEEM